jgi:hypothetical protein
MIVDINDGYIEKMEARDVYDTDGRLTTVIDPPPGIDRVADRYYMRDANYNPDFPTSARQIAWFLEESKGPSADTVIAIDQGVMEEVLKITGPLAVSGFPFQLKPETFTQIVSFYVEAKLSGSGSPKQILFDMIPILKRKLLEGGNPEKLIGLIRTLAAEGHIQAFSFSDQVQALFRVLKFDGAMMKPEAGVDYLSVISTSIGGNKSDAYIQQTLRHSTEINKEGQVENTLKIHKAHTWAANDDAQIDTLIRRYGAGETDPYTLKKILGKGDNLDYMRVYVPPGARLLSAEGIEPDRVTQSEINGYTVFAFIFGPVKAGGGQAITLKYSLPFRIESRYRLAVDKQAGAEQVTIKKGFKLPESLRFISAIPDGMDANTESVGNLDQDKFYRLIFEQ